jgi:N-acyl-D-amino-acid deacylase
LMGEMSRRSGGRPVSFALTQVDHRNDIYSAVISMTKEQNAQGANLRPQTTSRGIGILFGLHNRSPFDRFPTWRELRALSLPERLAFIRNSDKRAALIADVITGDSAFDARKAWVLLPGEARYDCLDEDSLAAHAARRGVSAVEAFLQIADATNGAAIINIPFLNQSMTAVEAMLDDPVVTLGLADAGAHVGMIMDSSQPTNVFSYELDSRPQALEHRGRYSSADIGHRRPVWLYGSWHAQGWRVCRYQRVRAR